MPLFVLMLDVLASIRGVGVVEKADWAPVHWHSAAFKRSSALPTGGRQQGHPLLTASSFRACVGRRTATVARLCMVVLVFVLFLIWRRRFLHVSAFVILLFCESE